MTHRTAQVLEDSDWQIQEAKDNKFKIKGIINQENKISTYSAGHTYICLCIHINTCVCM